MLFIHVNQAGTLRVYLTISTQSTFLLVVCASFCRAGPPQRVDCFAPMKISIEYLSMDITAYGQTGNQAGSR